MRVLFVSAPLVGHLYPMVPLARAMRDAGHDVLIASGGDAARTQPAGLPVRDIAPGFDIGTIARRLMLRHPLIARAELAGTAGTRGVSLLFAAVNEGLADAVVALVDEWAPDLVVHEPLAVAGALAAARAGVPAVLHGSSLFDDAELARVVGDAMRRPRMDGVPPATAILRTAPASLVGHRTGTPMRPVPYGGDGSLPDDLREPSARPRILVSRSTVAGPAGGDLMGAVVAAAPDVDAEFVLVRPSERLIRRAGLLTTGPDTGAAPDAPSRAGGSNIRAVGWIPLAEALAGCAAIVHHGGTGTILAALAAGVPQLVVPGPGDRRHNAEVVAARGAGLAVAPRRITADHLRRLLTDPGLAKAAGEVRDEIAAMPAPADVAATLP
ncbi:nucleotide disphospho-sugar-binding domain-containing protein [Rugosimonospora africana]|uniref:Glycosyl transferase n=1 Tax=Rugosimonospora africana TaxID=556532 RepID=A0A8J3QXN9_9ACTN|nr:nucleotide disphospho-sugar-binding domain-containing protein [Rugosimonospora africana]GIH17675.1 glycosyl transferase [Rugosimonospora africana]